MFVLGVKTPGTHFQFKAFVPHLQSAVVRRCYLPSPTSLCPSLIPDRFRKVSLQTDAAPVSIQPSSRRARQIQAQSPSSPPPWYTWQMEPQYPSSRSSYTPDRFSEGIPPVDAPMYLTNSTPIAFQSSPKYTWQIQPVYQSSRPPLRTWKIQPQYPFHRPPYGPESFSPSIPPVVPYILDRFRPISFQSLYLSESAPISLQFSLLFPRQIQPQYPSNRPPYMPARFRPNIPPVPPLIYLTDSAPASL